MWRLADQLVHQIYLVTRDYPKDEVYGLTSQLRRAVLSVPLNIVEGYARESKGDFRRFLAISLGSLAEVEYLLELSVRLRYLSTKDYKQLERQRLEVGKTIWSYKQKIGSP